jgi:type III pantothenate kinase
MVLAIDIGNTSISVGLFVGWDLRAFKLNSHPPQTHEEYARTIRGMLGGGGPPRGAVICSVVPGLTQALARAAKLVTGRDPLLVDHRSAHGLSLEVDAPEEVGADRLAGCAAAASLFGAPAAVVSFGTATTVTFVGAGNSFKGGAILPGPALMAKALSSETARLPRVPLAPALTPLGRNTAASILSGIIYGTAGAVERIIAEGEALEGEVYKVVVTGGALDHVLPALRRADHVEPSLALRGLRLIYERTSNA